MTARLDAQFAVCCVGGPPILREQYFTGPATLVSVFPVPAGGDSHAAASLRFTIPTEVGSGTAKYDLAIVMSGDRWLIDDVVCTQSPITSSDYQPGGPHPFECT